MSPNEVARFREVISNLFEEHPDLQTVSMSCLKDYFPMGSYGYQESVYFVTRFGDMILKREDFVGNIQKLKPIVLTDEVISAINGELFYQTSLYGSGRADAVQHGVAGQLVTLKVYTDKALEAWTSNPGDDKALDALRKVAAIAVRALVEYGCPKRKPGIPKREWMTSQRDAAAGEPFPGERK